VLNDSNLSLDKFNNALSSAWIWKC
jgi:hypothetical protein